MQTDPYIVQVGADSVAPAGGALIVDSGQLAAGIYDADIVLACADTLAVGKGMIVEHRNAANGATLRQLGGCPAGGEISIALKGIPVALNERIRVIAMAQAGAALAEYVASINLRKVK